MPGRLRQHGQLSTAQPEVWSRTRNVPFTRSQVTERYGDHCYYCPLRGQTGAFEGLDHVVCVAAGGHHTLGNIRPCCRSCNSWKRWTVDEQLIRDLRVDLDEVESLFNRMPTADSRGR